MPFYSVLSFVITIDNSMESVCHCAIIIIARRLDSQLENLFEFFDRITRELKKIENVTLAGK